MIGVFAVALVVLAGGMSTGDRAACLTTLQELTSHLPELIKTEAGLSWRRLPVTPQCTAEGTINGVAIEWRDELGLVSDARSAAAALGARINGDTPTLVRSAFDRCVAKASAAPGESFEFSAGRTSVSCTYSSAQGARFVIARRGET